MHYRLRFSLCLIVTAFSLVACNRSALQAQVQPTTARPTAEASREVALPSATQVNTALPTARSTVVAPTTPPSTPVSTPPLTAVATPTPAADAMAVVANGGNVRETPISGAPLDQVNARETVRVLGKNVEGTWYFVVTPRNMTGWVSATLLTIDAAASAQVSVVDAATQGSATATTAGWTTRTIGQSTLALPSSWKPLPLTEADLEDFANAVESQNPEMAQLVRSMVTSELYQQIQFFALDASTTSVGANVSLVTIPRPGGIAPDTLLEQTLRASLK